MQFPQYPTQRKYNNLPSGYPVCTVVCYKPNGDLVPICFGVEINSERFRYTVTSVKSIKDNGNIITYECTYHTYGQLLTILLRFDIINHRWMVG